MQDGAPGPAEEGDERDSLACVPWRELAACRGSNPSVFFPERGDTRGVEYAKSICAGCCVQFECLEENLFEDDGIFGGLSGRQRRQMRSRMGQTRTCRQCERKFIWTNPGQTYCSDGCKRTPREPVRRLGL